MVKIRAVATLPVLLILVSCELFTSSPFPGYLGNILYQYDYEDLLEGRYDSDLPVVYEIFAVQPASGSPSDQLYMLLSPYQDAEDDDPPDPELLLFNGSGVYLGEPEVPSGGGFGVTTFFSHPFGVSENGKVLAGRVSIDPSDPLNTALYEPVANDHAGSVIVLSGSSDPARDGTYLVSDSGGSKGSFTLQIDGYDDSTSWSLIASSAQTINIIPEADQMTSEEILAADDYVGYSLRGIVQSSGEYRFLVEYLPTETLYVYPVTTANFEAYSNGATVSLEELAGSPVSIDLSDSYVYTAGDQFVVRRDSGKLERYNADGTLQDSVVAEHGADVTFAFSSDGLYMYRFNADTGSLTVYETWWSL